MLKKILSATVLVSMLTSCFSVPAGYRAVEVNLFGNDRGVQNKVLSPGRYIDTPSVEFHLFPTFLQTKTWEGAQAITFQTKEGMAVTANVGLSYSIREEKIADIFQKYRRGVEEITEVYLKNLVRDAFNTTASTMTAEDIYGPEKRKFLENVTKEVKDKVSKEGFDVSQISIVGTMKLPDSIVTALNNKLAATQRAQQRENELREAEAQARKMLTQAKAEAEANKLKAVRITPELLEYERIQNQRASIEKWDGKLPQVSGGSTPLLQLK